MVAKTVWLSQTTFDELWALTHNIQLRMQSNIKTAAVSISGSGTRARINILLPSTAAGDTYQGPFRVMNASNDADGLQVVVYDGSDTDSDYAGYVEINGEYYQLEYDYVPVTATGYVYVQSEWDDANDMPGDSELLFSTAYPRSGENIFRRILAKVEVKDNRISGVYQYQYGPISGTIWGTCESE